MNSQDISVGIIAIIIASSGLFINATRRPRITSILLEKDEATLTIFRWAVPAALLAGLYLYAIRLGHHEGPRFLLYAGYILVAAGLGMRWMAVAALGKAFTVRVSILRDHSLHTKGPYKFIRHPSYTGLLMYYAGLGLVMENWFCLLILVVTPAAVVFTRISLEEKVLTEHFKEEYTLYANRTWRLVPYIY